MRGAGKWWNQHGESHMISWRDVRKDPAAPKNFNEERKRLFDCVMAVQYFVMSTCAVAPACLACLLGVGLTAQAASASLQPSSAHHQLWMPAN
jgi:hypothetical protein